MTCLHKRGTSFRWTTRVVSTVRGHLAGTAFEQDLGGDLDKVLRVLVGQAGSDRLEVAEFDPGDPLPETMSGPREDAPPEEVAWLVLKGSVDEWCHRFHLGVRRPGDLLDLDRVLLPTTRRARPPSRSSTRMIAREAGVALPLRRAAVAKALASSSGFGSAVRLGLAEAARAARGIDDQVVQATRQYFPWLRPQILPPPLTCDRCDLYVFFLKWPEDPQAVGRIRDLTPPGVVPYWDALPLPVPAKPKYLLLLFASWTNGRHGHLVDPNFPGIDWTESAICFPARAPGSAWPRLQMLHIFPSNPMVTFIGRELSGLPKVLAGTFIEDGPAAEEAGPSGHRLLTRYEDRNILELWYRASSWPSNRNDPGFEAIKSLLDPLTLPAPSPGEVVEPRQSDLRRLTNALDPSRVPSLDQLGQSVMPGARSLGTGHMLGWKRTFAPDATYKSPAHAWQTTSSGTFVEDRLLQLGVTMKGLKWKDAALVRPASPLSVDCDLLFDMDLLCLPLYGVVPGVRLSFPAVVGAGSLLHDYTAAGSSFHVPRWGYPPGSMWP